jgi:hypothetical protein
MLDGNACFTSQTGRGWKKETDLLFLIVGEDGCLSKESNYAYFHNPLIQYRYLAKKYELNRNKQYGTS